MSPGPSPGDPLLPPPSQDPVIAARLLAVHLQSGQLRLTALRHAASQAIDTPHQHPPEGGAGSLEEQAATPAGSSHGGAAAPKAARSPQHGAGLHMVGSVTAWCPIHTSAPARLKVTQMSVVQLISTAESLYRVIQSQVAAGWERLPQQMG